MLASDGRLPRTGSDASALPITSNQGTSPMRLKTPLMLALATVALLARPGLADEKSHREAAEDLLTIMEADKQMQLAIDQSLEVQIKSNPQLAQFRDVLKAFFSKYMTWDAVKEDMISAYADAFEEA